ncbi:MAG: division/cell wall cluster transcriptional repressor MraZ [Gammaproteobacteria bacterium]|nr:division/cell wall cluster transcriptional repressor MraZ [Gammaproteobacteria bacterium]
MFRGINNLALDAKGRVAMPARYRERLLESCAGRLIVTIEFDSCLLVYPLPEWEKIEEKLVALPSMNKQARTLQRRMMGHATECEIDSQGRIRVPTILQEQAGLDKKVVMIGQGKKFEIWDEKTWQDNQNAWLDDIKNDEEGLHSSLESLSL